MVSRRRGVSDVRWEPPAPACNSEENTEPKDPPMRAYQVTSTSQPAIFPANSCQTASPVSPRKMRRHHSHKTSSKPGRPHFAALSGKRGLGTAPAVFLAKAPAPQKWVLLGRSPGWGCDWLHFGKPSRRCGAPFAFIVWGFPGWEG